LRLSHDDNTEWRNKFQTQQADWQQPAIHIKKRNANVQINPNPSIEADDCFSCFDTKLVWTDNGDPSSEAHLKLNQQLKHLNENGIHTKTCFKAIPSGVCERLSEPQSHLTLVGDLFGRGRNRFPAIWVVAVNCCHLHNQKVLKFCDLSNPGPFGGHLCALHPRMPKSAHLSQTLTN